MIGLDTNVLARYIAQDDADQAARATHLIEALEADDPGFISLVVLVELHWVLRRAYDVDPDDCAAIFRQLLQAQEIRIQESEVVARALVRTRRKIDFPDALIAELGAAAGCGYTVTFDRIAARLPDMHLITKK